jgi:hypothetical protein
LAKRITNRFHALHLHFGIEKRKMSQLKKRKLRTVATRAGENKPGQHRDARVSKSSGVRDWRKRHKCHALASLDGSAGLRLCAMIVFLGHYTHGDAGVDMDKFLFDFTTWGPIASRIVELQLAC